MPTATGKITSSRKNRKGFQLDDGNWYSRMQGAAIDQLEEWRSNETIISVEWFEKDGWKNFEKDPTVVEQAKQEAEQQSSTTGGAANGFKKGSSGSSGGSSKGGYNGYKKQWSAYEDKDWQGHVNNRITRQNALNNAVSLVAAVNKDEVGPDTVDLVTTVANLFVEWVEGNS